MPTIDLPPWLQTVLTLGGIGLVLALVAAYEIGRAMVRRDPTSVWGARLVLIGVGLRAIRRSRVADILPPPVRMVLVSLTEADSERPPASTTTTVTVERTTEEPKS